MVLYIQKFMQINKSIPTSYLPTIVYYSEVNNYIQIPDRFKIEFTLGIVL